MQDSARVKRYHRTGRILRVAGFLVDLAVLLILLFAGWTLALRTLALHGSARPWIAVLIYLGLFGIITQGTGLPLDFLQGFWLEHRYGLSNLTLAGWVKDELKGVALGGALAALGIEFLYAAMRRWPEHWWILCSVVFIGFFILLANLEPILIFPIFFKFKPLENPSLTERLLALSRRARTRVKGVFEWKLSEKSKKANAALTGLGNTRRIILSDTLLAQFQDEEVEAVLAHELGHHVHRHMFQGIVIQGGTTFLGFYLIHRTLGWLSPHFGFQGRADFANLPLLALVTVALSLVLLPAVNAHSRSMERQADAYALRAISSRDAFISSMEKLAELNLAERRPHPWIEFIFHSHPSIEKRIAFAQRFSA
ncbi:MAG: M48 family metallopeptidase [Acidobacteriia bacterium]|nr:M48 family metallopeptidase [Terriglobia bacterium]